MGFHARPSMKIIECIQKFKATVWIRYQGREFVIDSLLDLISLCIPTGATITLKAEGRDAGAVLREIEALDDFRMIQFGMLKKERKSTLSE